MLLMTCSLAAELLSDIIVHVWYFVFALMAVFPSLLGCCCGSFRWGCPQGTCSYNPRTFINHHDYILRGFEARVFGWGTDQISLLILMLLINVGVMLRRFKSDRDEIWQDYSSRVAWWSRVWLRASALRATTLGMLLTPMCLCRQALHFGTGQRAVMLCDREGNRRSGVALAMRHGHRL